MSENSYNEENTIDVDFEIMSEVDVQVGTVYQSGASALADLSDVNLTTPSDGQILTYDAESDKWVNGTAPTIDAYTKAETDTLLAGKANVNNTYTKTEVDTALQSKANAADVYSKSDLYTKTETDELLDEKADVSQIAIKDGTVTFQGYSYPQPDSYMPFSMWFMARDYYPSQAPYAYTQPTTSSQGYALSSGALINSTGQVTGEECEGIDVWQTFTDAEHGTLYINNYYVLPLYRVDFNYLMAGQAVSKLKIRVNPDQMGEGDPDMWDTEYIREWTKVQVKFGDNVYSVNLPMPIVGGWVELADGNGSGESEYVIVDMGDLTWNTTADGSIFRSDPITDLVTPTSTSTKADLYCESLATVSQDTLEAKTKNYSICVLADKSVEIYDTDLNGKTGAQVKSRLDGYIFAYKTSTPTAFNFSGIPHLVNTIYANVGANKIYADCGQIEECCLPGVKVPADTVILTNTLSAGSTLVVFTDSAITDDAMYDFYTDTYGVNPTSVAFSSGSLSLTFEEQQSDVQVKVVIH